MNRRTLLKAFAGIPLLGLLTTKAEAKAEVPNDPLPVLLYAVTPDGKHMAAVYNHPDTTDPCCLVPVYVQDAFRGFEFICGTGMSQSVHFFEYADGQLKTFDGGVQGHKLCLGSYQHVAAFVHRHTTPHKGQHHVVLHIRFQEYDRPPVYALYPGPAKEA